jgi:uncharacterized membrane protein YozB (DUF420 family)
MSSVNILERQVLHEGTPSVVSQITLTLMLVVLSMVLIGIGFGFLIKSKEGRLEHKWVLSASLVLTLGAILLVMLPAMTRYYLDPDVDFFSSLSIITIIHGIVGLPTIATSLIYAFGHLPKKTKKWMRITAFLWIISTLLGILLFLQMMEVISLIPFLTHTHT